MVTKPKKAGGTKKGRVNVGKLKLNKETVKDLSGAQKKKVRGGLIARGGNDTKLLGTCTFVKACG